MRSLQLEAAIWNLFASPELFEAAARECEDTMKWFGTLAVSRGTAGFGRNNQIFDTFKSLAREFSRGAELARSGDYRPVWETARCVRGDVRGMMEQPLHSWMSEAQYNEFDDVRLSRLLAYARNITRALQNAMAGAEAFYNPNPDYPARRNDDDGFPGDAIVRSFESNAKYYKDYVLGKLPEPLPEYVVDRSIACRTGDEVPWTGVWYPSTGLERHSLTFAVKGQRMQPVYRVIKTTEELRTEECMFPRPETVAVETTWHPVVPRTSAVPETELRAKAGEPCPKAGVWQPLEGGASHRTYEKDEVMANLGTAYGFTVWRWVADR